MTKTKSKKKKQSGFNGLIHGLAALRVVNVAIFVLFVMVAGIAVRQFSQAADTAVKLVSWNVGLDNPGNVGSEVRAFLSHADIMGTQELSIGPEQDSVVSGVICATCGFDSTWTTHKYDGSYPNKYLIIWRKSKYTKVDMGFVDVSPRVTVNDKVGETLPVKFIAWTKLKDIASGKQFYVVNTHLVNGVESGGKPRTDVSKLRLDNYRNHMDKMLALITTLKANNLPIFITGDFNVNYRYDRTVKNAMFPYVRMATVGAKSTFQILNLSGISSTTPSRLIDYVFVVSRTNVVVSSQKFSTYTHGSDHYGFYATAIIK